MFIITIEMQSLPAFFVFKYKELILGGQKSCFARILSPNIKFFVVFADTNSDNCNICISPMNLSEAKLKELTVIMRK